MSNSHQIIDVCLEGIKEAVFSDVYSPLSSFPPRLANLREAFITTVHLAERVSLRLVGSFALRPVPHGNDPPSRLKPPLETIENTPSTGRDVLRVLYVIHNLEL